MKRKRRTKGSNEGSKKWDWKNVITIAISLVSLGISIYNVLRVDTTEPLLYNVKTEMVRFEDDILEIDIKFSVSQGAIGNVQFIDFKEGKVNDDNTRKYTGGKITRKTKQQNRVFSFELVVDESNPDRCVLPLYILIDGLDGTKNVDLVLCDIDKTDLENVKIVVNSYTIQDLDLLAVTEGKEIYQNVIEDYKELLNVLGMK